jgi:uncharacterized OsmC-like protein
LEHTRSGQRIVTDAPPDNNGRGEAFSPTDLTAASLIVCKMTVVGILMEQGRLPQLPMHATVLKHMSTDSPRRIVALDVQISVQNGVQLSRDERHLLEATANGCPVARSLHPDIRRTVTYQYGE